jgi:hypothetical protein
LGNITSNKSYFINGAVSHQLQISRIDRSSRSLGERILKTGEDRKGDLEKLGLSFEGK